MNNLYYNGLTPAAAGIVELSDTDLGMVAAGGKLADAIALAEAAWEAAKGFAAGFADAADGK